MSLVEWCSGNFLWRLGHLTLQLACRLRFDWLVAWRIWAHRGAFIQRRRRPRALISSVYLCLKPFTHRCNESFENERVDPNLLTVWQVPQRLHTLLFQELLKQLLITCFSLLVRQVCAKLRRQNLWLLLLQENERVEAAQFIIRHISAAALVLELFSELNELWLGRVPDNINQMTHPLLHGYLGASAPFKIFDELLSLLHVILLIFHLLVFALAMFCARLGLDW